MTSRAEALIQRHRRHRPAILSCLASIGAVVFLIWVYFYGLKTWFFEDDFAWLGLLRQTNSFSTLLQSLFTPSAQGTMRFISERGFFLVFESLFGFDNLPWRIAVFATAAADIALIAWLTRRATGSRLAAALAPFFWIANPALALPMGWDSVYNEILCALFLMTALALFDRYAETGRISFWWCQLVVFIVGFGALEINTVYPALAAAWVIWVSGKAVPRRKLLIGLLPLAGISLGYFFLHQAVAPFLQAGPYAFHVDRQIFDTFGSYLKWSFLPRNWEDLGHSHKIGLGILALECVALVASFVAGWRRQGKQAIFFAAWFCITLGPMLPLPNHVTDYYLTIPIIGFAMLAAGQIAQAARRNAIWRLSVLVVAVVYFVSMVPAARSASHWWYERSQLARTIVLGVEAAHRTHPGKTIVISGATGEMWDTALAQAPFYPLGIDHVYLTPGSENRIRTSDGQERVRDMVLDPDEMRYAVTHSEVVVYSVVTDHLRNVTETYAHSELLSLPQGAPRRVEIASPLFAYLLGPQWFSAEGNFRWMPGNADLRMGGPVSADDELILDGYYPNLQRKSPVEHLSVAVDGIPVGSTDLVDPGSKFHRVFKVPASLIGKALVDVNLTVDPVAYGPDGKERGLIFGTVEFGRVNFNPN